LSATGKWQEPKKGGEKGNNTYICEDAVGELVFLGAHALLDDRVPNFDILGVPWCPLERGDGKVHISLFAKLDEPPRKFIRLQKWAPFFSR
jgi:hypothetical protein